MTPGMIKNVPGKKLIANAKMGIHWNSEGMTFGQVSKLSDFLLTVTVTCGWLVSWSGYSLL